MSRSQSQCRSAGKVYRTQGRHHDVSMATVSIDPHREVPYTHHIDHRDFRTQSPEHKIQTQDLEPISRLTSRIQTSRWATPAPNTRTPDDCDAAIKNRETFAARAVATRPPMCRPPGAHGPFHRVMIFTCSYHLMSCSCILDSQSLHSSSYGSLYIFPRVEKQVQTERPSAEERINSTSLTMLFRSEITMN